MPVFSRYTRDFRINLGSQLGVSAAITNLRNEIQNGNIAIESEIVTKDSDRLDSFAALVYGDARLWWVLAASSNIGWGMQVPPGTVIRIVSLANVQETVV